MAKKRIYISGGITGLPLQDVEKCFNYAELILNTKGWCAVNPMKLNLPKSQKKTWENFMINDLKALIPCHAIYMLRDWQKSNGARIEHAFAIAMNKTVYYHSDVPTVEHLLFLEREVSNG
jgi:hypothetical protein